MYLCVMSLSSHDWLAHQPLGVLQKAGQGECVSDNKRKRERGKEFASDKEVK